jgi:hypothetical protein
VSVALGLIGLGTAFLYASIKCVKLVPLLKGDLEDGDHCTGTLLVVVTGLFALIIAKMGSGSLGGLIGGIFGKGKVPVEPVP